MPFYSISGWFSVSGVVKCKTPDWRKGDTGSDHILRAVLAHISRQHQHWLVLSWIIDVETITCDTYEACELTGSCLICSSGVQGEEDRGQTPTTTRLVDHFLPTCFQGASLLFLADALSLLHR